MRSNHLEHLTEMKGIKHQNNCLILANEIRMRYSAIFFPDTLMEKYQQLDSMDFRFAERLMDVYGDRVEIEDYYPLDIVLMNFDKQICLGTRIDEFVFFLGNSGIDFRNIEKIGKYIIGCWRPKNYCDDVWKDHFDMSVDKKY